MLTVAGEGGATPENNRSGRGNSPARFVVSEMR